MKTNLHHPLNSWTCLATFNRPEDAQRVGTLLESQGVETKVQDERRLQRFWFFVAPRAGVHLQVLKDSYMSAKRFLDRNPQLTATQGRLVRCPSCHSSRVQYPAMTRKNILPTIVAHILVLLHFM